MQTAVSINYCQAEWEAWITTACSWLGTIELNRFQANYSKACIACGSILCQTYWKNWSKWSDWTIFVQNVLKKLVKVVWLDQFWSKPLEKTGKTGLTLVSDTWGGVPAHMRKSGWRGQNHPRLSKSIGKNWSNWYEQTEISQEPREKLVKLVWSNQIH